MGMIISITQASIEVILQLAEYQKMFEGLVCISLWVESPLSRKKDSESVIKNNTDDFKINYKEITWKIALSLGSEIILGK